MSHLQDISRFDLLVAVLDQHELVVIERLKSFLSDAVVRVEDQSGERFVLKFMGSAILLQPEYETMAAFAAEQAAPPVRLLNPCVMQMQDLGCVELYDEPERSYLDSVAKLLRRAHQAKIPASAQPLQSHLIEIYQERMLASDHLPTALLAHIQKLRPRLESEVAYHKLLHGDLQIKNIMKTERGPLLIDPYGMVGPAIYDVATVAATWPKDKRQVFEQLLDAYPQAAQGVDVEAWYRWVLIYRLYNAYHNAFPTQALEAAVDEL